MDRLLELARRTISKIAASTIITAASKELTPAPPV